MATERIYQTDQYAVTNDAVIIEVQEKDGFDVISCDSSVFFPEGGGQPSDTGTVASNKGIFEVTHVFDESLESDVWHLTDAPAGTFKVGDSVTLTIDFDYRFSNMQRHLGEHMLSGAVYSLFDGANKGFHMGEEYITVDIDLGGRMFTDEELDLAERTVNEAIWADLPVTVTWFDDYESSLSLPARKQMPHEGRVSVVTVGDEDDPFDRIACCGTHPSRSSEVGLLAIYKCEPNKGMNRIYFDCGSMAKDKLSADSHILGEIAKKHSCSPADLPGRLEIEEANTAELKAQLTSMKGYIKDAEEQKIEAGLESAGTDYFVYSSDLLDVDDLLKLGFNVINKHAGLFLVMAHPAVNTCLLLSSDEDRKCGNIVKEFAPKYGGRGGGRPDNARAVFENSRDMQDFIKAVTE